MINFLLRCILAVTSFYVLVHVSPALAVMAMAVIIMLPMIKISYEIAQTEDRRVRAQQI